MWKGEIRNDTNSVLTATEVNRRPSHHETLMSSIINRNTTGLQRSFFALCRAVGLYNPAQSWREKTFSSPSPTNLTLPGRLHLLSIRRTLDKANPSGNDLFSIYHATMVLNKTYPNKLTIILGCCGKLVES